jgi:hypothetical protein
MGDNTISDALDYIRPISETNTTSIVLPSFSAVVMITDGIISNVEWDNGCWTGTANCIDKPIPTDPSIVNTTSFKYTDRNNYLLAADCAT